MTGLLRPTRMRILAAAALLALTLTGCSERDQQVATDPAPTPTAATTGTDMPAAVPAAPGLVRTRGLVTVVDSGSPEMCLGVIAQIAPPTCTGPALGDWDWKTDGAMSEQMSGTRWGAFALSGTWDGTALAVTDAVPGALYDPVVPSPTTLPTPATSYDAAELAAVAEKVGSLPGAVGATADDQGHVLVDVTYDDGSLQAWADQAYGTGVVVVTGQLVDAAG